MYYCGLNKCDTANGPGFRVSLFVSGCTHHCDGCFNPETWDFSYGEPFNPKVKEEVLAALSQDVIDGLTLLGGDPCELANMCGLVDILEEVRFKYPSKTIWCYTGYTIEQMFATAQKVTVARDFLNLLDVLVDGPFEETNKCNGLAFRGSSNQRILKRSESGDWTDVSAEFDKNRFGEK